MGHLALSSKLGAMQQCPRNSVYNLEVGSVPCNCARFPMVLAVQHFRLCTQVQQFVSTNQQLHCTQILIDLSPAWFPIIITEEQTCSVSTWQLRRTRLVEFTKSEVQMLARTSRQPPRATKHRSYPHKQGHVYLVCSPHDWYLATSHRKQTNLVIHCTNRIHKLNNKHTSQQTFIVFKTHCTIF